MGGENSVDRPGTRLISDVNTHADPIVRYSQPPFGRDIGRSLAEEDANIDVREVRSVPSKIDEHRGQAITAVISMSAPLDGEGERGGQSQSRWVGLYTTNIRGGSMQG